MANPKKYDPEHREKLAQAVQEKITTPTTPLRELASKYGISTTTLANHTTKTLTELCETEQETIETIKKTINKGNKILARFIEKLNTENIEGLDDYRKLAEGLKIQQSIINQIEKNTKNENVNLIPVNIQINY
jgi:hypothetical protein